MQSWLRRALCAFVESSTRATCGAGLVALVMFASGCGHVGYGYGQMDATATAFDTRSRTEPLVADSTLSGRYHEVVWLDTTGAVASATATQLDATGSAMEAARKARRERKHGPVEYSYKRHLPSEFNGILFGGYFRWADAQSLNISGFRDRFSAGGTPAFYETGIEAAGTELFWPEVGLGYSASFRLNLGMLSADEQISGEDMYMSLPMRVGLYFAPSWLFGGYLQGDVGVDLWTGLAAYKHDFYRTGWWRPWEARAVMGHSWHWTEWLTTGVSVQYSHTNQIWADHWLERQDIQAGATITLDWTAL